MGAAAHEACHYLAQVLLVAGLEMKEHVKVLGHDLEGDILVEGIDGGTAVKGLLYLATQRGEDAARGIGTTVGSIGMALKIAKDGSLVAHIEGDMKPALSVLVEVIATEGIGRGLELLSHLEKSLGMHRQGICGCKDKEKMGNKEWKDEEKRRPPPVPQKGEVEWAKQEGRKEKTPSRPPKGGGRMGEARGRGPDGVER